MLLSLLAALAGLGACSVDVPLPSDRPDWDASAPLPVPDATVSEPDGAPAAPDAAPAGDAGDDPPGTTCWEVAVPREMVPPRVVIAFDRSGTMSPRVEAIRKELTPALAALDGAVEFGYLEFPDLTCDPAVGCCGASELLISPALGSGEAIGKLLACDANGRTCIVGPPRTPSDDALRKVEAYFTNTSSMDADRFVVMITDGAPSCGGIGDPCGKARSIARDLWQSNLSVRTAIFAISPQARFSCLRGVSEVGGNVFRPANSTDPPFVYVEDVITPEIVKAAVAQLLSPISARSCVVKLAGRRDKPVDVTVRVNGIEVNHDLTHTDGWDYEPGRNNRQIRIYGPKCSQVQQGQLEPRNVQAIVTCEACGDRHRLLRPRQQLRLQLRIAPSLIAGDTKRVARRSRRVTRFRRHR